MKLILLGAPGAGKGTQANIIMQSEGLCALSTGNLLREVAKEDSEKGREIKAILESSSAKALKQMYPAGKKCKDPSVAGAERTRGE